MDNKYSNIEILAPAGDTECFDAALDYGADAVYLGRETFGMRAGPKNFSYEQLKAAVDKAHLKNVKVYLTCNILPRNDEVDCFRQYIEEAVAAGVDALIVADLGLLAMIKKYAPDMEIHMSTQTGIVNYASANELYNMGAKRVVLARELSLEEIAEIRAKTPAELDIEAFVHGAMCVSFSGRCLLSQYLTARDPNRGQCAQPCRWGYYLMEEKRDGMYFPIFEDEKGTYILNSKDMCMLDHIDDVVKAGVMSLKIEGRAKSAYYVSVVTNAYRMAADILKKDPDNFTLPEWLRNEVFKISHRSYCTGFFYGRPEESQYYADSGYIREYDAAAMVEETRDSRIYCVQKNKFSLGDEVEIMAPGREFDTVTVTDLRDEEGAPIENTCHAAMRFSMPAPEGKEYPRNSIIRIQR
ncbi:MAG: U32 family peptidase [Oscillospiraceae bacterium]|nr:U32 family peptidase [Oscillospiraceae bacterium]